MDFLIEKSYIIKKHNHKGLYLLIGENDNLATINLTPGNYYYGEILVDAFLRHELIQLRIWNPFRSKLAAAILAGLDIFNIYKGNRILYLGASFGSTVSHCSDIIGKSGMIFAVERSVRNCNRLIDLSKSRKNIIPIVEDARYPYRYRMLVPVVDIIICDVAQRDQARILGINALYFLKKKGYFYISFKASSIDSNIPSELSYSRELNKLLIMGLLPFEQISLEPYEKSHCVVTGSYLIKI
mmetsp:Transcript_31511/g.55444  ORF Transcript_31511/g.55444 Transcript_31511/m.55444 type:complete len:241 (-) Transcript_31511:703-1425(-)